jgi:hypothetical protein
VRTESSSDWPDSADFSTPDVVVKQNFTLPNQAEAKIVRMPVTVTLQSGWYLMAFSTDEPSPVAIAVDGNTPTSSERAYYFTRPRAQGVGMGKIPYVFVEGTRTLAN